MSFGNCIYHIYRRLNIVIVLILLIAGSNLNAEIRCGNALCRVLCKYIVCDNCGCGYFRRIDKGKHSCLGVLRTRSVGMIINKISDCTRCLNLSAGKSRRCLNLKIEAKCLTLGKADSESYLLLSFADLFEFETYSGLVACVIRRKCPRRYKRQNHTHNEYNGDYL